VFSEFQNKLPGIIDRLGLHDLRVDHFHAEAFDDELAENTKEMAPRYSFFNSNFPF
jgi:hypothetical protein